MRVTPITQPEYPAVGEYPTHEPFKAELDAAQQDLFQQLEDTASWISTGEKDGVKLWKKPNADDKGQQQLPTLFT